MNIVVTTSSIGQELEGKINPRAGFKKYAEGAVYTSGMLFEKLIEQTVLEMAEPGEISGGISLKEMRSKGEEVMEDDEVTIKSYMKLGPESNFELHESDSYSGAQTKSSLRFLNFVGCYKITLTQTAGRPRTYPYLFFQKV